MTYNISNFWPSDWWPYTKIEEVKVEPAPSFTESNGLYLIIGTTALTVLLGYAGYNYLKRSNWNKREVAILPSKPQYAFSIPLNTILEKTQKIADDYKSFFISINIAKAYCKRKNYAQALLLLQTAFSVYRFPNITLGENQGQSLVELTEAVFLLDDPFPLLEDILKISPILNNKEKIQLLHLIAKGCPNLGAAKGHMLLENFFEILKGNEKGWESIVYILAEGCFILNPDRMPPFLEDFIRLFEEGQDPSFKLAVANVYLVFDKNKGLTLLDSLLNFSFKGDLERFLFKIKIAETYSRIDSGKACELLKKLANETTGIDKTFLLKRICKASRGLNVADSRSLLTEIMNKLNEIKDDKKWSAAFLKLISICSDLGFNSFTDKVKIELQFKDLPSQARYWIDLVKMHKSHPEKVKEDLHHFFSTFEEMVSDKEKALLLIELCKACTNLASEQTLPILEDIFNSIFKSNNQEEYFKVLEYLPPTFWENSDMVSKIYEKLPPETPKQKKLNAFRINYLFHVAVNS